MSMPAGRKAKIERMYNCVANLYDMWRSRAHPANLKRIVDMLDLGRDDQVLDVGTGPGIIPMKLRKMGVENPVCGVDLSPRQIELACRKASSLGRNHLSFEVGDMEALPMPGASFSRITCVDALLLADDRVGVLSEFHRVLRPGGRAVLVEPKADGMDKAAFYLGFNAFIKAWAIFRPELKDLSEQDFRGGGYFDHDGLRQTVQQSPLHLHALEEDKTHYYCVCRK
jgi:ubiquinone/menaquinone biosynthesis C-methylase UbiE